MVAERGPADEDLHAWAKTALLDYYVSLRQDVEDAIGMTLFPFYGTLLGAVREQDLISQDVDFDTAYISERSDPDKVRSEFKELCHHLLSRGYSINAETTHTWINVPGTAHRIGIYFAWFTPAGNFDASYGYHGPQLEHSADFFETRLDKINNSDVPVPSNAEVILDQLYGSGWRTPDPEFVQETPTRKQDDSYLLATSDVTELHWSQFYRDHEPDRASRFAEFVAERFVSPGAIVEFGCGSGRDGIYFANRGWNALSCDRSPEAIARANQVLHASGGLPVRFAAVDAASSDEVGRYLANNGEILDAANPLLVYLRFFLHAIDEYAQETLLDALTTWITRDFYLCAEFRTVDDRDLTKHHGLHYRRYIDHEQLADQLRDGWGFDVQHLEAGQGLSPYDGENPYLGRLVAYRPNRENGTFDAPGTSLIR